jgi:hypothetical protein
MMMIAIDCKRSSPFVFPATDDVLTVKKTRLIITSMILPFITVLEEISHPSSSPARRQHKKVRTLRSQEIQNALFKRRSSLEASQSRKGMNESIH